MSIGAPLMGFCMKADVYFTTVDDDRILKGDLFYDVAKAEFQMRTIKAQNNRGLCLIPLSERGPVWIHMHLTVVDRKQRELQNYMDIRFNVALVSGELMAFIEEHYSEYAGMVALVERTWEVRDNLAWVRS